MDEWKLELCPPRTALGMRGTRPCRWWFVRVASLDLRGARAWLENAGRVMDEGKGTAANPEASWFVIQSRCSTIEELREHFGPSHTLAEHIEEISQREHGCTLASQLPLIG